MLNLQKKKEAAKAKPAGPVPIHRAQSTRTMTVVRDLANLDLPSTVRLIHPDPNIVREFDIIVSPSEGIWKDGRFKFHFSFPPDYNIHPPTVRCMTQIWHPNVDTEGHVCLNILRDTEWTAVMDIQSVIFGLLILFYEPNTSDPLNHDAAHEMIANIDAFKQKVRRTFQGGHIEGHQYERQPINF